MDIAAFPPKDTFTPLREVPMAPAARRLTLFRDVDIIIDIGANTGQYARWVRRLGFAGKIASFEPGAVAYAELCAYAVDDPEWECHELAVGATDDKVTLNVAEDSISTSLLLPAELSVRLDPRGKPIRTETVPMRTLAGLWPDTVGEAKRVYLKIDAEGSELAILRGAGQRLRDVTYVEVEMSVTPMFDGGPLLQDVVGYLVSQGFAIVGLEHNGGDDPATGQMLMMDGIFRADDPTERVTTDGTHRGCPSGAS